MSKREFTVTELQRGSDGGYVDTPVKFTWTNETMSAPRGSWSFGLEQRTVREDYPGVEAPIEQVLGPNYKEFTLNGVWDDRYTKDGFALATMREFELLVQRGSLCRFAFETISIVGIIKDVEFDYRKAAQISYSFTVSPHYRETGGVTTGTIAKRKTPEAFTPVTSYRDTALRAYEDMENIQVLAPATKINGTAVPETASLLDQLRLGVGSLVSAVEQRLGDVEEQYIDLKRTANALNVVKDNCVDIITRVATLKSDVSLAYDDAVAALDFDAWRCGLASHARLLGLTSWKGKTELSRRVDPKAVATYKPRKGESLYSISQRFYGTPSAWQLIATRNGLTTIVLQGTETLIIPERR